MYVTQCRVRHSLPLFTLLVSLLTAAAHAATTRNVPAQYATIQAAVNAAVTGDTVLIADGTYTATGNRDIDTLGKNLTVKSINGAAKTTIDCGGSYTGDGSGSHRGFYIHSGETVTLIGLTIENGYTDYNLPTVAKGRGGGVYMQGGSVTLQNCTITNCASTGFYSDEEFGYNEGEGGAICNETYSDDGSVPDATLTLTNCTITGNTVSDSGGGVYSIGGTLAMTGCTVSDNGGGGDGSSGGGIYCGPQSLSTLKNCQITGNNCTDGGSGLNNYGSATLTDCTVSGNSIKYYNSTASTPNGGGIHSIGYVRYDGVEFDATLVLTNCIISNNTASSGGGVANEKYSTATLTNCTLDSNVSGQGGGFSNYNGTATLTNCSITANSAGISGDGGGVYNRSYLGGAVITLTRCKLLQNSAGSGGGFSNGSYYSSGGSATLTNCTVFGNTASAESGGTGTGTGGGVYNNAPGGSVLTVINCTVTANSAGNSGSGLFNYGGAAVLTNDILYGDTGGEIAVNGSAAPIVTYSDMQGGFSGTANINADPQFARPVNLSATPPDFGDLRLKPSSPCLGAGNHAVAPATDKAGVTRPNPPSIGAFEKAPAPAVTLQSVSFTPTSGVGGNTYFVGALAFTGPVPASTVVTLSSSSAALTVPASVTVPAGATGTEFNITTQAVTATQTVTVTATQGGVAKTTTITLTPQVTGVTIKSFKFSPTSVVGGKENSTGTITLSGPAPSDIAFQLNQGSSSLTFTSNTVTVPAGASFVTFRAISHTVTAPKNVSVAARSDALGATVVAYLKITPVGAAALSSLSFSPASVTGGTQNTTGTVTLTAPAPSGGAVVSLGSNSSALTLSVSSVTVAAGATSATFRAYSHTVTATKTATITATYAGVSKTATVTVTPPVLAVTLQSLSFNPATVKGGSANTTGTVTLTGPAPSGGAVVTLASSSSAITFPASTVTVAAGATSATFRAYSHTVTSTKTVTVTATYSGASKTATVTVTP